MKRIWQVGAGVVAVGLIGTAAVLWMLEAPPTPAPPPEAPQPLPVTKPPSAPPPASQPAVAYPIEPTATEPALPPTALDVEPALTDLFGRKAVLSTFQLQDFARRFVATVDNLGREHAPVSLWPVNPARGRFIVEEAGGTTVISADNGLRYTPYLLLIEAVDLHQVVAVYRRLYPLLQQAYEDIGYPKRYFNDRLIHIIDLLLATPDVTTALQVHLPTINGPVQPARPWVLYEFSDPALQSLPAGQKILLRIGPVNERRMKAKLAELRRLLTARDAPR